MTETTDKKRHRDAQGRFSYGNPGRPKGARHKATVAAEALLDGQAEALTAKAVEMALDGDATAMRLCLERLLPARKDRPVQVELPAIESARDTLAASAALIEAVSQGELTPGEAAKMTGLIEATAKAIELRDLEARIEALEQERMP